MKINKMGVINITPNSFSDGNTYNSKNTFRKRFEEVSSWADIIDIGSESTAPKSEPIASEVEIARFEKYFFSNLEDLKVPHKTLSIDTYHFETFLFVKNYLKSRWDSKIIWNDVSGSFDDDLMKFFKEHDNDYIFCHNLAPKRDLTSYHMDYLLEENNEEFVELFFDFYKKTLLKLGPYKKRIILDPCFGFSKTKAQNLFLLKNFKRVREEFAGYKILFGISRKSFLRFKEGMSSDKDKLELDFLGGEVTSKVMEGDFKDIIVRTHTHLPLQAIEACQEILS